MHMTLLRRAILEQLKDGAMTADEVRQALGHSSVENMMKALQAMAEKGYLEVERHSVVTKLNQTRSLRFYSLPKKAKP